MYKYLENLLLGNNICTSLEKPIFENDPLTYDMVIHFICALPTAKQTKIKSDFSTIQRIKGNINYYFIYLANLYRHVLTQFLPKKLRSKQYRLPQ